MFSAWLYYFSPTCQKLRSEVDSGKASAAQLQQLSSEFFTIIPHNFGRKVPPVLRTAQDVQDKMDLLAVLADIETAMTLSKAAADSAQKAVNEVDHPDDLHYQSLHCHLKPVAKVKEAG